MRVVKDVSVSVRGRPLERDLEKRSVSFLAATRANGIDRSVRSFILDCVEAQLLER